MPDINFNLLNPSAELYSGPQVQMDPVAAYEKAKATRQSNMLAAQQGMGLRTGGSLADLSSQYGANMANIALGKGNIEAAKTAAEYGAYGNMLNVGTDLALRKFGGGAPGSVVKESSIKDNI